MGVVLVQELQFFKQIKVTLINYSFLFRSQSDIGCLLNVDVLKNGVANASCFFGVACDESEK